MPFVRYSNAQRLEAVALAKHIGAEAAADQLGMKPAAIRDWMAKAGEAPELAAEPGTWAGLMQLALAKTTALVASGKLSPTAIATIAGIAARNAHRDLPGPPVEERTDVEALVDTLEAELPLVRPDLVERYGTSTSAFSEIIRAFLYLTRNDPEDAEESDVDLEELVRTFDPDTFDIYRAETDAEDRARVAELVAASWRTHTGSVPGIHLTAMQPRPPDDLDALLAEADALLETMQ